MCPEDEVPCIVIRVFAELYSDCSDGHSNKHGCRCATSPYPSASNMLLRGVSIAPHNHAIGCELCSVYSGKPRFIKTCELHLDPVLLLSFNIILLVNNYDSPASSSAMVGTRIECRFNRPMATNAVLYCPRRFSFNAQ